MSESSAKSATRIDGGRAPADGEATDGRASSQAGQRIVRDPVGTKRRILAAAGEEFAHRGYDGARVEAIVRRSKVSKNLLYYYFGSKEGLFIAVLEAAYARLHEQQARMGVADVSPLEAVRELVTDLFHYWRESRDFIGFLTSENFHRAKHIKRSRFARDAYAGMIERLGRVLEAGAKAGVFRPGVDATDLYISISGLSYQYFANQHTLSYVLGKDLSSEEAMRVRLAHTQDVILGYLQYNPRP
jgi:TetR/AcrR family transcriptional regulator